MRQVVQIGDRPVEALGGAHDAGVVPHRALDGHPVLDHQQWVDGLGQALVVPVGHLPGHRLGERLVVPARVFARPAAPQERFQQ